MTGLTRRALLPAAFALGLIAGPATAQTDQKPIELKLAYYVGDQHAMSQWLIKWADKLEKDSGGRLVLSVSPVRRWDRCRSITISPAPARPISHGSCMAPLRAASR